MSLFFGAETRDKSKANAYVLGLCWDKSSSFRKGSAKAPTFIRNYTSSKLYNPYTEVNVNIKDYWKIYDLGDVSPRSITEGFSAVKEIVDKIANFRLYLFLGGDHIITYITLKALKKVFNGSWGLIYFDSHPDLYNSYEGDPYSHACTVRRIIDDAVVNPQHIVQIGIRASTAEQLDYAEKMGVSTVSTCDVYKVSAKKTSAKVNKILGNVDNVYISFDVDVLDPAFAPGVGNPEGGGVTLRHIIAIIHELEGLNIQAFDVVEANPDYDCGGITFYSISKFIREMLGVASSKLQP